MSWIGHRREVSRNSNLWEVSRPFYGVCAALPINSVMQNNHLCKEYVFPYRMYPVAQVLLQ